MKAFLMILCLIASSTSFATTTISGFVRTALDGVQYEILDAGSGHIFQVDAAITQDGSVCGQVLAFESAMDQVLGKKARLTGTLKTTSAGQEVFAVSASGVESF